MCFNQEKTKNVLKTIKKISGKKFCNILLHENIT